VGGAGPRPAGPPGGRAIRLPPGASRYPAGLAHDLAHPGRRPPPHRPPGVRLVPRGVGDAAPGRAGAARGRGPRDTVPAAAPAGRDPGAAGTGRRTPARAARRAREARLRGRGHGPRRRRHVPRAGTGRRLPDPRSAPAAQRAARAPPLHGRGVDPRARGVRHPRIPRSGAHRRVDRAGQDRRHGHSRVGGHLTARLRVERGGRAAGLRHDRAMRDPGARRRFDDGRARRAAGHRRRDGPHRQTKKA